MGTNEPEAEKDQAAQRRRQAGTARPVVENMQDMQDIVEAHDDKLDEDRQLKVTVPTEVLIQLHSVKILTGKNMSEQVREALGDYFEVVGEG